VVMGLVLVPKVSDAVAGPLLAASRPMVAHVAAILPEPKLVMSAVNGQNADPAPKPSAGKPEPAAAPKPMAEPEQTADVDGDSETSPTNGQNEEKTSQHSSKGSSYLDGMRDAGYPLDLNNDLNTLVSLKSLGVTPEYARQMGNLGFGKPSVHELISLKALGVTPEYVAGLKQSGLGPKDFHEVTTEKALGVTPEYATAMKQSGFGDLNVQEMISLKAQGATPEYVTWIKRQFPQVTTDELHRAVVFHLDEKFLTEAKQHGFDAKDLDKLLRLKISGLLD
jgi:hypothetical protein